MTASNHAGRLAIKTIEMTVGKQLNVHATVENQTGIRRWESYPEAVRQKFIEMKPEETLHVLPSDDVVNESAFDE